MGFGVAECLTDIPGSSDVSVGKGRSVLPGDRSHELSSLPDSAKPNRTRRRSGLSPRPHFRFCRPGRGTSPDDTRGIRLSFSLSFSGSIAGICKSPKRSACPDRKPSAADRKIVAFGCRIGPECRLLSGRSGSRPAPEPPPRRSPAEASYSVRMDAAIIYLIMRRAYPPRSCDISQPRLEAHRPCLRPFPATRSLPTEGSSRAKAGTSGHMIRDGDGLRVVSGISVRFPFSARRGRPRRAV